MAAIMTARSRLAARSGHGGTAPDRVREQIGRFRGKLAALEAWSRETAR